MMTIEQVQETEAVVPRIFATTHWGVVLAAGDAGSEPSHDALETLCKTYWYPFMSMCADGVTGLTMPRT
jgi:hypothetical protein